MTQTFTIYETQQNSDLTEGRGSMYTVSYWTTAEAAREAATGRGVMGVGDGDVVETSFTLPDDPNKEVLVESERIYGYRKGWDGKWGHGWVDNRDAPTNDPEYAEFLRLQKKFAR